MDEDLPDLTCNVEMASETAPGVIVVRWNATWIPPSLMWLDTLGSILWKVETFTILDRYRQESRFSWAALFSLFGNAFQTGVLRLPAGAMRGSTTLNYGKDGKLRRMSENYELVPLLETGQVKNRRIARDFLDFAGCRKPAGVDEIEWDAFVRRRCGIDQVPGMSQFDIDGLGDGARGAAYDIGFAVFGIATAGLLALSVALSAYLMESDGFFATPARKYDTADVDGRLSRIEMLRMRSEARKGREYLDEW